jgi:hypothetical protein
MVTVMRRKIAMIAVLGGLAAGLGCEHIGGKADCGYNPADYPIGSPTQPYPTYPVVGNPAPVKDKVDVPKVKPGSDMDPKKTGNE